VVDCSFENRVPGGGRTPVKVSSEQGLDGSETPGSTFH
jgi:hypothetical protein